MKSKTNTVFVSFFCAVLSCCAFCFLNSLSTTRIIIALPCLASLHIFYKINKKFDLVALILSVILSSLLLLGKYGVYIDESRGMILIIKLLVTFVGSVIFFTELVSYLFNLLEKNKKYNTEYTMGFKTLFLVSFFVIAICWIPYWLASYPGIYSPDTLNQINQSLALSPLNNRNPLIHTLIIRLLYRFFSFFSNDVNVIFASIGFVQLIVVSLIFSVVAVYVYKITKNKICLFVTMAFYALISFNAIYGSSISKDSVYTALLALFVVILVECFYKENNTYIVLTIVIGVAYSLMRSNGYFSLAFVVAFVFVFGIWKKTIRITIILLLIMVFSTFIRGPVYGRIINSSNKNEQNMDLGELDDGRYHFKGSFLYVMPFQQVANVVYHERKLNEKEEWLVEEYISFDGLKQCYNPMLVDPLYEQILIEAKPTRANISDVEYVKLWLELMIKYPLDYLESYVNMTKYYFYPNRYVRPYYEGIAKNELGLERKPIICVYEVDKINSFYNSQKSIPIIGSIFNPGTSSFILLFTLFFSLRQKNVISTVVSAIYIGNLLILLIAVPINDEFRYIYPIIGSLPIIVSLLFTDNKEVEK